MRDQFSNSFLNLYCQFIFKHKKSDIMDLDLFREGFPFSMEAKDYIQADYGTEIDRLVEKYKEEFSIAFNNLTYLVANKKFNESIMLRKDLPLIYTFMHLLVFVSQSTVLAEHFADAFKTHTQKLIFDAYTANKPYLREYILRLCKNTLNISIEQLQDKDRNIWRIDILSYLRNVSLIGIDIKHKLVSLPIYKGDIYLTTDRVSKFLGEAARRLLLMKFPFYLEATGEIELIERARELKEVIKDILTNPVIAEYNAKLLSNLHISAPTPFQVPLETGIILPHYPACMRVIISKALEGIKLAHVERLVLLFFCVSIGMKEDHIIIFFRKMPDFDESKTRYNIQYAIKKGHKSYACEKIKWYKLCPIELGWIDNDSNPRRIPDKFIGDRKLKNPDELCESGATKNPLFYYRYVLRREEKVEV